MVVNSFGLFHKGGKRKMKEKRFWYVVATCIVLVMVVVGTLFMMKPKWITWKDAKPKIEVHSTFDARENIASVKEGNIEDVTIDLNDFDSSKLGTYTIVYEYQGKKAKLKVEVVDRVAPVFETQEIDVFENEELDPMRFIKYIEDATETKVYLKEKPVLKEGETIDVVVVVEDEAGNKSEQTSKIHVLPADTEAPTYEDLGYFRSVVGNEEVDPKSNLIIHDAMDPDVKVDCDFSQVDFHTEGTYTVSYDLYDRANNHTKFERTLTIVPKYPDRIEASEEKVVYLTFDDGPSANTGRILDILDSYGVKATFFVTGNHPEYNEFIERAVSSGHTIGLHTYTHNYGEVYASKEAYWKDLIQVGSMVETLTGTFPRYIRFPGGSSNMVSAETCEGLMSVLTKEVLAQGYQYYDWNIDSTDAEGNAVPVSQIVANATAYDDTNKNILFHDTDAKDTTVEALPKIIEYYLDHGYTIKGIDDTSYTPHHTVNN